jgi:hypothetical protein
VAKLRASLRVNHAEEVGCDAMYTMLSKPYERQPKIAVCATFEVKTLVGRAV